MLHPLEQASPRLVMVAGAMRMMYNVTSTLNLNQQHLEFWKGDMSAIRTIIPVTHRLLSLPRLLENVVCEIEAGLLVLGEMLRLSCLLILAAVKKRCSMCVGDLEPLQESFRPLLCWDLSRLSPQVRGLELWALTTFALLRGNCDRSPLLDNIRKAMGATGVESSARVIQTAREFIWVNAVEEEQVEDLELEIDAMVNQSVGDGPLQSEKPSNINIGATGLYQLEFRP